MNREMAEVTHLYISFLVNSALIENHNNGIYSLSQTTNFNIHDTGGK